MDYTAWASEYWAAADKIGTVINTLTKEINLTKEILDDSTFYVILGNNSVCKNVWFKTIP